MAKLMSLSNYLENNTNSNEFVQNYTELLNKLEELTGVTTSSFLPANYGQDIQTTNIEQFQHRLSEAEYARFVSEVWIGGVLTLLILSIIAFMCGCFFYHKFQKWKNTYRTNQSRNQTQIIRRIDIDVESLPSYTLVSGLPTYDDALEQYRKTGLLKLKPPSVVQIFNDISSQKTSSNLQQPLEENHTTDMCICGGNINSSTNVIETNSNQPTISSVIELNPQQLHILSEKRLSLQITFNSNNQRPSRNRIGIRRESSRNNTFTSHEIATLHNHSTFKNNENSVSLRGFYKHRGSFS